MIALLLVPYGSITPQFITQEVEAGVQNTALQFTPTTKTSLSGNTIVISSTEDSVPRAPSFAVDRACHRPPWVFLLQPKPFCL